MWGTVLLDPHHFVPLKGLLTHLSSAYNLLDPLWNLRLGKLNFRNAFGNEALLCLLESVAHTVQMFLPLSPPPSPASIAPAVSADNSLGLYASFSSLLVTRKPLVTPGVPHTCSHSLLTRNRNFQEIHSSWQSVIQNMASINKAALLIVLGEGCWQRRAVNFQLCHS